MQLGSDDISKNAGESVAPEEIARFSALADQWWDTKGPMRPLHAMNKVRIRWTDQQLSALSGARGGALHVLDLGCGAGIASESLAKCGYHVLGLDASEPAINAARQHLSLHPLPSDSGDLEYRHGSAETLIAEKLSFDAVTAYEIIEHVTDPEAFMCLLSGLVAPGGRVVVSTMNRTWRSYGMAKLGAEYVLRLLPTGTHDWRKFVTPSELGRYARKAGLRMVDIRGMTFIPPAWRESRDLGVNYIAVMVKD